MFLDSWEDVFDVLWIGVLIYIVLIVFLRASGNRTLSKLNSFDFVVTIALGSTLSAILVNRDVSFIEGAVALGLLVLLQFIITWLSRRSSGLKRIITTEPTILYCDGEIRDKAMTKVRITHDELISTVRKQGIGDLEEVAAVVMESDGKLSVISKSKSGKMGALKGLR